MVCSGVISSGGNVAVFVFGSGVEVIGRCCDYMVVGRARVINGTSTSDSNSKSKRRQEQEQKQQPATATEK